MKLEMNVWGNVGGSVATISTEFKLEFCEISGNKTRTGVSETGDQNSRFWVDIVERNKMRKLIENINLFLTLTLTLSHPICRRNANFESKIEDKQGKGAFESLIFDEFKMFSSVSHHICSVYLEKCLKLWAVEIWEKSSLSLKKIGWKTRMRGIIFEFYYFTVITENLNLIPAQLLTPCRSSRFFSSLSFPILLPFFMKHWTFDRISIDSLCVQCCLYQPIEDSKFIE